MSTEHAPRETNETAPTNGDWRAEDYLTVKEVAGIFRVGANAVYAAVKNGELEAVHFGSAIRIPRTVVERKQAQQ